MEHVRNANTWSLETRSAVVCHTQNIGKCTGSVRTSFSITNDHVAFEERSPNVLATTEERLNDRGAFDLRLRNVITTIAERVRNEFVKR